MTFATGQSSMGVLLPVFEKLLVSFLVAMLDIAFYNAEIPSLSEFQTSGVYAVIVGEPTVQLCLSYAL